jgi:hypothetical protein
VDHQIKIKSQQNKRKNASVYKPKRGWFTDHFNEFGTMVGSGSTKATVISSRYLVEVKGFDVPKAVESH